MALGFGFNKAKVAIDLVLGELERRMGATDLAQKRRKAASV